MKKILTLSSAVLLLMTLVSCNGLMDYLKDIEGQGGYLSDLFAPEPVPYVPVPGAFRASRARYADKVRLRWDAVDEASYYFLEKGPSGEGPFTALDKAYGLSWDDITVESGQKYWYRIRAYSSSWDLLSDYSSAVCGYLLGTPTGVNASKGLSDSFITVSWNPVEGASGYDIYQGLNSYPPNNAAASVSGIDSSVSIPVSSGDQGKEFRFWLKSKNSFGETSPFSLYSMGFTLQPGAPPLPQNLTVWQGQATDSIALTWDGPGADYFLVYRWSSINSQEELITPATGITASAFTDSDTDTLKPGVRYYYAVQAVKRDTSDPSVVYKSAFCEEQEGYLLSPPQDIGSFRQEGNVHIEWAAVPGAETEEEIQNHAQWKYRLEYSESQSGPFTPLSEVSVSDTIDGRVTYIHSSPPSNQVYYRILTVNGAGTESAYSELDEPVPNEVENLNVSRNAVPAAGETPNGQGVYPVHLSWNRPAGAVRFRVERATQNDGNYAEVGETVNTVYTDTDNTDSMEAKKHYYYRIVPVNSLGKAGDACTSVTGYGALTDEEFIKAYNDSVVASAQSKLTLMHKGGLDALGSETKNGTVSGTIYYNATGGMSGAYVTMLYTDYCDFLDNLGNPLFTANGNSNTNITNVFSQNGNMEGVVDLTGMYPGQVDYSGIQIHSGSAGGGVYTVTQEGRPAAQLDWTILN